MARMAVVQRNSCCYCFTRTKTIFSKRYIYAYLSLQFITLPPLRRQTWIAFASFCFQSFFGVIRCRRVEFRATLLRALFFFFFFYFFVLVSLVTRLFAALFASSSPSVFVSSLIFFSSVVVTFLAQQILISVNVDGVESTRASTLLDTRFVSLDRISKAVPTNQSLPGSRCSTSPLLRSSPPTSTPKIFLKSIFSFLGKLIQSGEAPRAPFPLLLPSASLKRGLSSSTDLSEFPAQNGFLSINSANTIPTAHESTLTHITFWRPTKLVADTILANTARVYSLHSPVRTPKSSR